MKLNLADPKNKFGVKSNIYKSNFFSEPTTTREGFLEIDTILFRQAVLPYTYQDPSGELIEINELIGDSIFTEELIQSAQSLPFVLEHPQDSNGTFINVSPENYKDFIVGVLHSPRIVEHEGERLVIGTLKIFDPGVQQLILNKELTEVSQGYFCTTEMQKGMYNGVKYDAIQKGIILNHLALVSEGRAGDTVRLLYNTKTSKAIMDFVQNSKHGVKTMNKNKNVQNAGDAPEDKDPASAPVINELGGAVTGSDAMMGFMMKLIEMLITRMGGGPVPASNTAMMPGELDEKKKDQMIGNAAQMILKAFQGQPAAVQVNANQDSEYLNTKGVREMIAENIRDHEKAVMNAKAILGNEAATESLKYNSLVEFKKAVLVKAGKSEDEVKSMDALTVNAHFDAITSYSKDQILEPRGGSIDPSEEDIFI